MTAANHVGGFNSKAAKRNTRGIDQIPLGLHSLLFGEEGFHEKRGQELGFRGSLSTPVFIGRTMHPISSHRSIEQRIHGLVSPRACVTLFE